MAISLSTVVEDYLDSITTALTVGTDVGSGGRAAAQNYLRAMDMASVLDLLQEVLSSTGHAALSGTTSSITDTNIFTINESVGNVVVFASNTTTVALRGVESRIRANSQTVLTVDTLPAAPVSGDTYSIRGGVADSAIASLRQGKDRGDSPSGSVYGSHLIAISGLTEIIRAVGGTVPAVLSGRVSPQILVHPGAQPGENAVLAAWISTARAAVEAHTIVA